MTSLLPVGYPHISLKRLVILIFTISIISSLIFSLYFFAASSSQQENEFPAAGVGDDASVVKHQIQDQMPIINGAATGSNSFDNSGPVAPTTTPNPPIAESNSDGSSSSDNSPTDTTAQPDAPEENSLPLPVVETPQQELIYLDPSVQLRDFHKNRLLQKFLTVNGSIATPSHNSNNTSAAASSPPERRPVKSSNYIFRKNHLDYAVPTKKNLAIGMIYGDEQMDDEDRQTLFLGAIKTLRHEKFGNWRGSVLLITDRPKFLNRILAENAEFLQCRPELYDPIPSMYMKVVSPKQKELPDPNPCRLSVFHQPAEPGHPLAYKWTKSKMLHILEKENERRLEEELPVLDYLFYRDADIWCNADVGKLIKYLQANYRGEDALLWPQPGKNMHKGGQWLHGGIWMLHRELSFYWLRTWSSFMTMTNIGHKTKDQISLSMIATANSWDWKWSNERRRKKDYSMDMHLMKFDTIYPLDMTREHEWRNGVFLHWSGRETYPHDIRAYGIMKKKIGASKIRYLKYKADLDGGDSDGDTIAASEHAFDDEILLRDANGKPMDIIMPLTKVDCVAKQSIMHAYQQLKPRRLYILVPRLKDCEETIYFAPNIRCFPHPHTVLAGYLREKKVKENLVRVLGGENGALSRFVFPTHVALPRKIGGKSWTWGREGVTENFLYITENSITLDSAEAIFGDSTNPFPFVRESNNIDSTFARKVFGSHLGMGVNSTMTINDIPIPAGMLILNQKTLVNMMEHIIERHKMELFSLRSLARMLSEWIEEDPEAKIPAEPVAVLYAVYTDIRNRKNGVEKTAHETLNWTKTELDDSSSSEMPLGKHIKGRCITKDYMNEVFQQGHKLLRVI